MTNAVDAPLIVQLRYQSGVISLSWEMQGITPASPFQISIKDDSTGQTTNYSATGFFKDIQQNLQSGGPYSATVATDDNGVIGPPSPSVSIITVSPAMTLVQNTGAGLSLRWNKVGSYQSYAAVLQQLGKKSSSQSVVGDNCNFTGPLVGSGYSTSVAAQSDDQVSIGPVAQSYTPIQVVPAMTLVQNTGDSLILVWESVGGYSKYKATLQAEGSEPNTQDVAGNSYTFTSALTASAYTTYVAAQSDDGVLVGPPGKVYQPILVVPTMTAVENTGAGLKLDWATLTGFTRYNAVLQKLGSQSLSQSVEGLTWTFDGTLSGVGYSTAVAAQSDDEIVLGPPGTVYVPIVGQPTLTELDYDARQLVVTWQKVNDQSISGYVLQITDSAGQTNSFTAPDTDTRTLSVDLQPVTYSVVARAANGIVLGPWSAPLVPLTAAPGSMSLGFDGTHLSAFWAQSGQANVTGYVVSLLADGAIIETFTPASTSQLFASGLSSAVVYTSQARAAGPRTRGPWSTPAVGPYAVALTYTFDAVGRVSAITWNGVKTLNYAFEAPGNITSVEYS